MIEYDHLCRSEWAERAKQQVDGFDVNITALGLDKDIRDNAQANFTRRRDNHNARNRKGGSKVRIGGLCPLGFVFECPGF